MTDNKKPSLIDTFNKYGTKGAAAATLVIAATTGQQANAQPAVPTAPTIVNSIDELPPEQSRAAAKEFVQCGVETQKKLDQSVDAARKAGIDPKWWAQVAKAKLVGHTAECMDGVKERYGVKTDKPPAAPKR